MQAVAKYASPLIGWGTQVVLSLSGVQSPVLAVAVWVFIAALIWWAWLTPSVNAGLRWARAHGFLDLTETGEAHLRLGALGVGACFFSCRVCRSRVEVVSRHLKWPRHQRSRVAPTKFWRISDVTTSGKMYWMQIGLAAHGQLTGVDESLFLKFPRPGSYPVKYRITGSTQTSGFNAIDREFTIELG